MPAEITERKLRGRLLYVSFRYLHAGTGRWLSRDPIGEKAGINLYLYAINRAINRIDLLGLKSEEDCHKELQDAMLEVAKVGARCNLDFLLGGAIDAVIGFVAGGVATIVTCNPLVGGGVLLAVGGVLGIKDFYDLNQCIKQAQAIEAKAKADFEKCIKECKE